MRLSIIGAVVLGVGVGFVACSSRQGGSGAPSGDAGSGTSVVQGVVFEVSGGRLGGAVVSAGGASTVAAADGTFSLSVSAGPLVVTASASGHVDSAEAVVAAPDTPAFVPITLAARSAAVALDAAKGGRVAGPRGSSLTAPAGAFVDALTGAPVTGTVLVALTPLDPSVSQELRAYPGRLLGVQSDGSEVMLESMGVVEIDAEQNGRRLTVTPGMTMTLVLPAPANATALPTTSLWSLDESRALWKAEGTALLDAATQTYSASLAHLSWFNLDTAGKVGCVKGRVIDCKGQRRRGVNVLSISRDPPAGGTDTTDVDGLFSVASMQGASITLDFIAPDATSYVAYGLTNGTTTPAGVTSSWASGYIAKDDPACEPVGDVVVGTGCTDGFVSPDGGVSTGSCFGVGSDAGVDADAADPWTGSCGAGMAAIFTCWAPSGSCAMKTSISGDGGVGGITITYANGATMVWSFNAALNSSVGTLTSASKKVCGTMSATTSSGSGSNSSMKLTSAATGQTWTMTSTGDGGERLTCPDGSTETLSAAQLQSVSGCASTTGAGGGSGTSCSQRPIGWCDVDPDCASLGVDLSCCMTKGGNVCVDATSIGACLVLQNMACASDADCSGATPKCCPAGTLNLCTVECD